MIRTIALIAAFAIQLTSAASALPFTFINKNSDGTRFYSGQATVKGRFTVLWEISEFDDRPQPKPYLVVRMEIKKETAKVLPPLPRGEPSILWLRNTDKALDVLLPKKLASDIRAHKFQRVEGDAEITITSLQVGVTCDQWGVSAEVATANALSNAVATNGPDEISSGGC
jgi:hypothetical protein